MKLKQKQKLFLFSKKSKSRILDIQISWQHQFLSIKKYILLNNLGSKCSLLMKFGQFISYYKKKTTLCQKIVQKLHLFVFVKNLAQAVLGNEIFEASYLFA